MTDRHYCDRVFTDENTGRVIRQLTNMSADAYNGYFRSPRHLPDGRMLAWYRNERGHSAMLLDPASGDIQLRPEIPYPIRLRERDGRLWFVRSKAPEGTSPGHSRRPSRAVWQVDLPDGTPQCLCTLSDEVPGNIAEITCDGENLIIVDDQQDMSLFKSSDFKDPLVLDRYLRRPRSSTLYCYTIRSGLCRKIHHLDGVCFAHVETSPVDPTLIRYAQDMTETHGQRVWTIRIDGGELRKIRPQELGEVVTHEFWWSTADRIGYTYQDRRNDPTVEFQHCAEYAEVPTRFGLADLAGKELFLSDPLNSYHTHIMCSPDGKMLAGEGTDKNSFVFVAPFDINHRKIDFKPLATIHTPYVAFRGQCVESGFSSDGQWLVYGDTRSPDQKRQLFAVKIE